MLAKIQAARFIFIYQIKLTFYTHNDSRKCRLILHYDRITHLDFIILKWKQEIQKSNTPLHSGL